VGRGFLGEDFNMNFAWSAVAAAVLSFAIGFVVHGMLLAPDYANLKSLFRPEAEMRAMFAWMIVAHVLFGIAFAWIYMKGREDKPFLFQGARFGLAVAVLATIPTYLIYYVIEPWPAAVVVKQIIFDTIGVVVMGIVVAWIQSRGQRAAPA
jgi:hypothetical protein